MVLTSQAEKTPMHLPEVTCCYLVKSIHFVEGTHDHQAQLVVIQHKMPYDANAAS